MGGIETDIEQTSDWNSNGECACCPYGHHIDLNFASFAQDAFSVRKVDTTRLEALRDKWRAKRLSLDKALVGDESGFRFEKPKYKDVGIMTEIQKANKTQNIRDGSVSSFSALSKTHAVRIPKAEELSKLTITYQNPSLQSADSCGESKLVFPGKTEKPEPEETELLMVTSSLSLPENTNNAESQDDLETSCVSNVRLQERICPSEELKEALNLINDGLLYGKTSSKVSSAINISIREWFKVAGTRSSNPANVKDYLDYFRRCSKQLLRYVVNIPDGHGNLVLHYAISYRRFDIASILLESQVCDTNKPNKSGYTSVMLVFLADKFKDTDKAVVQTLFDRGDVNSKAAQHGQTALMLAASHGRLDTVKMLIDAGADVNIQDDDGSTALMCAAEHGHAGIVEYLLGQWDCDPNVTDNDGSSAFNVAMEAGHKDIAVMIYVHIHFVKRSPPPSPCPTVGRSIITKRSRSSIHCSRSLETPRTSLPVSVAKKQNSSFN